MSGGKTMGISEIFKRVAGTYDGQDEEYDEEVTEPVQSQFNDDYSVRSSSKSNKILSIPATTHLQVIVVKPERINEAPEIADHFKDKKTVVLNLDNTNKNVANRLLDFLGGVAYAMDGELKRIANTTYIIVPRNVDISGDMIEELGSNADFN